MVRYVFCFRGTIGGKRVLTAVYFKIITLEHMKKTKNGATLAKHLLKPNGDGHLGKAVA